MKLSVIIPCLNESGNIEPLYGELTGILAEIATDSIYEPIRDYLKHTDADDDLEKILAWPYYNRKYVETLLNEHSSKERDYRKKIWNLYCGTFC